MKFFPTDKKKGDTCSAVRQFINPGGFFFCEFDCQIHTLLGSCIAITLWHPVLHIGGMCHFVLPGRRETGAERKGSKLDGRYSDDALLLFEREARRTGTRLSDYQAKIFGGGNMLTSLALNEEQLIGKKNIDTALRRLSEKNIPVLVTHVGESGYRRITFDLKNGDVWVKHQLLQDAIPNSYKQFFGAKNNK